jgi:hypothetical protein
MSVSPPDGVGLAVVKQPSEENDQSFRQEAVRTSADPPATLLITPSENEIDSCLLAAIDTQGLGQAMAGLQGVPEKRGNPSTSLLTVEQEAQIGPVGSGKIQVRSSHGSDSESLESLPTRPPRIERMTVCVGETRQQIFAWERSGRRHFGGIRSAREERVAVGETVTKWWEEIERVTDPDIDGPATFSPWRVVRQWTDEESIRYR